MSAANSALFAEAVGLGFDSQWLGTLVNRFGPDILALLIKAARAYSPANVLAVIKSVVGI